VYVSLSVGELYTAEPWGDFVGVDKGLKNYSFDNIKFEFRMIPYFFGVLSMEIFGTYRIAPFIASIISLFLTYLVTVQITKKRFAGIIAVGIVLQSENFLTYDSTITYPIMWIMFFLLAIYFIFKRLTISPISFVATMLSHPLSVGLFPITIPFIAVSDLPKRKKILTLSTYFVLIAIGAGVIFTGIIPLPTTFTVDSNSSFDGSRVIAAFASILTQFRYDGLIVVFLLPLVVCLFLASRKGIPNANAVLVLISGIILLVSFVPALTAQGNTPYRILPLVFFFAIGVGTLLSKNTNSLDELQSKTL